MFAPTGIFAVLAVALIAGIANALPPQKIVGGTQARPGEFPYQVSLRNKIGHFCGGAIISERHIITAAHCVYGETPTSFCILTGSTDLNSGETHYVKSIIINSEYSQEIKNSIGDIALITLYKNIIWNVYQNKIYLPIGSTPAGSFATVSGWGYRNANMRTNAQSLMKLTIKTLSNAECTEKYGFDKIHPQQICTQGDYGYGTCMGDSGGPLALNNELIGIVSWGMPCAVGLPDVFTNIAYYLEWIHSNMYW